MSSVHGQPLVWLAEVPWNGLPQRHHHIVRCLRERWDVLFVEPPRPLRPPRSSLHVIDGIRVVQVAPLINTRLPALQRLLAPTALRRAATLLGRLQVRHAVRRAWGTLPAAGPRVVCSNVYLAEAALDLRPARLLLDLCDDPRAFSGVPTWTADLLAKSVACADVVSTSSRALAREVEDMRPDRSVHYIANGVRAELLTSAQPRADAASIGFVGYLGPWVDIGLLAALADALPDRCIELIGPVDPEVRPALEGLQRRPNVRLRAPIAEADVPHAIASFSVGLIPFHKTALTAAVNPNKLYEYAAQDLPIVATDFSADLSPFREAVDICATADDFVRTVRARVERIGVRSTRWIAESHTWQAIAAEFERLLN